MADQTLTTLTAGGIPVPTGRARQSWRRFRRRPAAMAGLVLVAGFLILAVAGPFLAGDPSAQDYVATLKPPSGSHLLGTDDLGRDVLARIAYGARVSLEAGVLSTVLAMVFGVPIGLVAGYYRRLIDPVVMRLVDVVLAFPFLVFAVGMAAILGPSLRNVVIALSVSQLPGIIRITRGEVLVLREMDYVSAAVADGAGDGRIMFRYVLPGATSALIVQATVGIPTAIIGEATLSFLGLGVQPPTPSWGVILTSAQQFLDQAPWLAIWPGLMIALATLGFNLLGDGLRDVLDPPEQPMSLLEITGLRVGFDTEDGEVSAVREISLTLEPGEILALCGESGCGKSVTAMSVPRLLPPDTTRLSGSIRLDDRELTGLPEKDLRQLRGKDVSVVFQEPMTSLNPSFTVGFQIAEVLRRHEGMSRQAARTRAIELLELVGIPAPARRVKEYPHQLSGGMRQRVMIAIAVACSPRVLIADEPTTALDVTIQAGVLDVFRDLRDRLGTAIILITHDLGVVADIADRAIVMYAGRAVEQAPVTELFARPRHPYTAGLMRALPTAAVTGEDGRRRLSEIPGLVPPPYADPDECAFHPRCPRAQDDCRASRPPLVSHGTGHEAACFHPLPAEDAT